MESQLAYMGDAQFDERIATFGALKKLDFNTDLQGHGVPFTDKGLITAFLRVLEGPDRTSGVTSQPGAVPRTDGPTVRDHRHA